jgi:nitrogen fixation/metabolism regulation signal transduction histidine kinase
LTFALLVAVIWLAAFGLLVWLANRVTRPIEELTRGLERLGAGERNVRLPAAGSDEAGRALASFNETSERLEQSRERLLYLARLESWQSLARKMAHELKNSLTPIRLTVEEMVARNGASDPQFLRQAAQIVTDEVTGLERRVRAFTEMAAEPPVHPAAVDLNRVVEERVTLLQAANPATEYRRELAASAPAWADEDLLRGILTNLLENAAHAAAVVLIRTAPGEIEVHDNGRGLSDTARATLFEPTISFKKAGMGLGLSIARRSALLNGGDLTLIEGELGGAAFRVRLPVTCPAALSSSTTS